MLKSYERTVNKKVEEEHPDVPVRVESCLDFCSDCALKPIAISNEYFMRADDIDSFMTK